MAKKRSYKFPLKLSLISLFIFFCASLFLAFTQGTGPLSFLAAQSADINLIGATVGGCTAISDVPELAATCAVNKYKIEAKKAGKTPSPAVLESVAKQAAKKSEQNNIENELRSGKVKKEDIQPRVEEAVKSVDNSIVVQAAINSPGSVPGDAKPSDGNPGGRTLCPDAGGQVPIYAGFTYATGGCFGDGCLQRACVTYDNKCKPGIPISCGEAYLTSPSTTVLPTGGGSSAYTTTNSGVINAPAPCLTSYGPIPSGSTTSDGALCFNGTPYKDQTKLNNAQKAYCPDLVWSASKGQCVEPPKPTAPVIVAPKFTPDEIRLKKIECANSQLKYQATDNECGDPLMCMSPFIERDNSCFLPYMQEDQRKQVLGDLEAKCKARNLPFDPFSGLCKKQTLGSLLNCKEGISADRHTKTTCIKGTGVNNGRVTGIRVEYCSAPKSFNSTGVCDPVTPPPPKDGLYNSSNCDNKCNKDTQVCTPTGITGTGAGFYCAAKPAGDPPQGNQPVTPTLSSADTKKLSNPSKPWGPTNPVYVEGGTLCPFGTARQYRPDLSNPDKIYCYPKNVQNPVVLQNSNVPPQVTIRAECDTSIAAKDQNGKYKDIPACTQICQYDKNGFIQTFESGGKTYCGSSDIQPAIIGDNSAKQYLKTGDTCGIATYPSCDKCKDGIATSFNKIVSGRKQLSKQCGTVEEISQIFENDNIPDKEQTIIGDNKTSQTLSTGDVCKDSPFSSINCNLCLNGLATTVNVEGGSIQVCGSQEEVSRLDLSRANTDLSPENNMAGNSLVGGGVGCAGGAALAAGFVTFSTLGGGIIFAPLAAVVGCAAGAVLGGGIGAASTNVQVDPQSLVALKGKGEPCGKNVLFGALEYEGSDADATCASGACTFEDKSIPPATSSPDSGWYCQ